MASHDSRVVKGWAFYDWANSVYPLVITTAIFPDYYATITTHGESDLVEFFGLTFKNTALYSYCLSFSFLVISILSPFLSGIADYSGSKKSFMQFFCYLGAASCSLLFFFSPGHIEWGMILVILASIGYSGSIVFYNAYLPEIAPPEEHDRISARGFSMGYIGSSILLILNLAMVMFPKTFGFQDSLGAVKLSFITVGLWWAGFSQVTFRRLPANVYHRRPKGNRVTKGFAELRKVWKQLGHQPHLKRYLASFLVFSMGVQTVMLMASLFGKKEIKLTTEQLIITVLVIQLVAIAGAYLFSYLSSRTGNLTALGIALIIWIGICMAAYFVQTATHFYVIAAVVGMVMGGVQSLARSTYSKLLPETTDHASYFSFYDICEKAGIVIGTFSFGYIEELTGSMRNTVFVLLFFFVAGLLLLGTVKAVLPHRKIK